MNNQIHTQSIQHWIEKFKELDERISHYNEIINLAEWDMQTTAPKKGKIQRSKALGTLSADVFEISVSKEMGESLEYLSRKEITNQLDEVTRAAVRERKRDYDKSKQIPSALYKEFVIHSSNAHDIWEEAKNTNDFSHFQPALEKTVHFMKQFIQLYGYEGHPYNALLDNYEPGLTVDQLDPLFAHLREKTIDLLQRIQNSPNKPRQDLFNQPFDVEKQKEFSLFVLPKLGYDLSAGRLDVSAHPFATGLNTSDVRITTRYLENDMRSAIFGTIHECGHALYEQGVNPDFEGSVLRSGTSMGIHESQSLFLENMIGRSYEFWTYFYNDLKQFFPTQFGDISIDEFCRSINTVEPSLIRVEADELTYNLHIMIRYEIEKGLMSGNIEVKDLPQIWNEKMMEYLGVTPTSDTEGVLQDVHWSFGGFGYFPSYALGNLYSAQFAHTMRTQIPNLDHLVKSGDFLPIREWLRENIHQYGKQYTPKELVMKVTGEKLNAQYLIDYLEEKYTMVYLLD
jgi:carboxypeptidase Taq